MCKPIQLLILDAPATGDLPEADVLRKAGFDPVIHQVSPGQVGFEQALAEADVLLTLHSDIKGEMLKKAERCQIVMHYGPGSGGDVARIDLPTARRLGIYVASIPDWAAGDWADRTMDLMDQLFNLRPIPSRTGRKPSLKKLRLGLVGLGCVGREVARRAARREMDVWACDPFTETEYFFTLDVHSVDLDELFGICDIISLHVPLGPATRGLVNRRRLNLLKRGSLLVNISSPELVELDALPMALERNRPAGAAFDDILNPYLSKSHPLLNFDALIHGPRQAGTTESARRALRVEAGRQLALMWQGNRPPHLLIDPPCPRHVLSLAGRPSFYFGENVDEHV